MLLQCPECGHDVSDQAESCPNCGYPVAKKTEPEKRPDNAAFKRSFGCFSMLLTYFSIFMIVFVVLFGTLFLMLRNDAFGMTTSLRTLAETDSGDGSHGDSSRSRIAFKYYMLLVLDAVSDTPPRKTPEPETPAPQKETPAEKDVVLPRQEYKAEPLPPSPPELPEK